MADDKSSPQENKSYARLNILQALQNARKDDYPLPVPAPATPTKPTSSSNGEGGEEEPGRQQKLREVVKTLQLETRGPPAPPPPAAMPSRSPRHSPSSK